MTLTEGYKGRETLVICAVESCLQPSVGQKLYTRLLQRKEGASPPQNRTQDYHKEVLFGDK